MVESERNGISLRNAAGFDLRSPTTNFAWTEESSPAEIPASTMTKLKTTKDLIMLLLHAPGPSGKRNEPITGQTRMMKMIFLFEKELKRHFNTNAVLDDSVFPEFRAYRFGPYAPKVYADLEWLVNMNFVDVIESGAGEVADEERKEFDYWTATGSADNDVDVNVVGKSFKIGPMGERFLEKVLPQWNISGEQWRILGEFKKRCLEASLRALLHYVYSKYPETTSQSEIRNEILGT